MLTDEQWSGADLRQIAMQAALPFRSGQGEDRVSLNGPEVRLPPKTAIAVALAVHELATNAVKYGALSGHEGGVDLNWSLSLEDGRRRLDMVWREHGGPRVKPPSRAGFGTRLIERGLASDLNGDVRIDYPPEGVVCTIVADLDAEESAPLATPDAAETRAAHP